MKLAALLLAVLWLPISTHEWLEAAHLIHSDDHCAQDAAHEAADGCCRLENTSLSLEPAPCVVPLLLPVLVDLAAELPLLTELTLPVIHSRSHAPPELAKVWHFSERAALPGRAPSRAA